MNATAIFITSLVGIGLLVAVGVFTVAWRRGPTASPIVGEFDKAAAKRDRVAAMTPTKKAAPAEPAPATSPETREDRRVAISSEDLGVTRRKFLNRAVLGLFGGGFLGSLGISMLAFLWPKLKGGFGTPVNAGPLTDLMAELLPGDGTITPKAIPAAQAWLIPFKLEDLAGTPYEGLPILVGAEGDEPGIMALWHRCVHLGCRVPDCQSSQGFECPCHGSKYNYHGDYEGGPAPRNLDRFAIELDDGGNLIIKTGQVFETPRAKKKTIAYPQGPSCL